MMVKVVKIEMMMIKIEMFWDFGHYLDLCQREPGRNLDGVKEHLVLDGVSALLQPLGEEQGGVMDVPGHVLQALARNTIRSCPHGGRNW